MLGLSHGWHQGEGYDGWISMIVHGVSGILGRQPLPLPLLFFPPPLHRFSLATVLFTPFAPTERSCIDQSHSSEQPDDQYIENRNLTSTVYNTVRFEVKPNPNPSGESMNPSMSNASYSPAKAVPLPPPSQTPGTGSVALPGATDPDVGRVDVTS